MVNEIERPFVESAIAVHMDMVQARVGVFVAPFCCNSTRVWVCSCPAPVVNLIVVGFCKCSCGAIGEVFLGQDTLQSLCEVIWTNPVHEERKAYRTGGH